MDKDAYIKKLERRIHTQRRRLRWFEASYSIHVHHNVWRKMLERRDWMRRAILRQTANEQQESQ